MRLSKHVAIAVLALLAGGDAFAQNSSGERPSGWHESAEKAGNIASQPVRDVGAVEQKIPPVLLVASENPYSLKGAGSCAEIVIAVHNLNGVLGPDYTTDNSGKKENRKAKLAEAGGATVVNSLIPFRGLVREVSGAAPAQRRYNAAVAAGLARRGFLRGLHLARKCRMAI